LSIFIAPIIPGFIQIIGIGLQIWQFEQYNKAAYFSCIGPVMLLTSKSVALPFFN